MRVDGPTGTLLRERIDLAPWLTTDESAGLVVATVVDDGGLVVLDDEGAPMRAPEADDERGRQRVVDVLELMAHARRLGDVRSTEGDVQLTGTVAIRFASIDDGVRTERSLSGCASTSATAWRCRSANEGDEPRYFWVFDVGISGRVEMITSGRRVGRCSDPACSRQMPVGSCSGPAAAPCAGRSTCRVGAGAAVPSGRRRCSSSSPIAASTSPP